MVSRSEIKVGNWLSIDDGSWGTVKSVGLRIMVSLFSGTRGFLEEELWGIVVNRDILSLCDFQLDNAFYVHKHTFLSVRYHGDGDLSLQFPGGGQEFAFVHQLQNLFFDATGQLLQPNLRGI